MVKFIPYKNPMSGQLLNPTTAAPLVPSNIDGYMVPIVDAQTYSVKTDISDILEQAGCRKIRGVERGFSVNFIPKVEQIKQFAVVGNTYSTVRRPWFPCDSEGSAVNHFGMVVYIRQPYDATVPPAGSVEIQRYQVEMKALIEFRGYDG